MKIIVNLFRLSLLLSPLVLTGCPSGGSSSTPVPSPSEPTGTLSITVPDSLPYNIQKTITVTLATTPATTGALGFSQLSLHADPSSSLDLLTISPDSSCLSIQASSTASSCTFIVTNNSPSAESTLNSSSYSVTAQFNGQTVTSNSAQPSGEPPAGTYWDISINNHSNSNKYLFVMGQDLSASGQPYGVVTFDENLYGTFHTYSSSTAYGSDTNSIILTPGTHIIHIPYGIWAGRAYISSAQMLNLDLNSSGGISLPDPGKSDDVNYKTIYDDFEFTYAPDIITQVPHAVVNQTAVDFVSTPICLEGSTNYQPIHQAGFCNISRDELLDPLSKALAQADREIQGSQWESLILKDDNTTLRIMSPGSSDALSPPTPSKIQSFSDYLDSYILTLASSVYNQFDSLQVVSPDGTQILSGNIQNLGGVLTYVFTNSGPGGAGSMPLTTANLLVGAPPGGANAGVIAAYQMVSAAFMAGQLPPTKVLPAEGITQTYLRSNSTTFYQSNSISRSSDYLYSVYSNALNAIQQDGIYTYAYDDVLGKSSTMTQTLSSASQAPDPLTVTVNY